jgi:hypothetical protein
MKRAKPGTAFVERALGRLAAPPGKGAKKPPPRRCAANATPVFNFAPRRQT